MPLSSPEGKAWTVQVIQWLKARTGLSRILDIGPGSGTYSRYLRQYLPGVEWVGLEAWAPYLEEYQLDRYYDQMVVCDARYVDFEKLGHFDVAFMGDILEHMTQEEATRLFQEVSAKSRFVVISIPIVHYPQDAVGGNPFERHVKDNWSHEEVLNTFPNIQGFVVHQTIGVYISAAQPDDQELLQARNREVQASQTTVAHWQGAWQTGEGWFEIDSGPFQGRYAVSEFQTFFQQHHQQYRDEIMGAMISVKLVTDLAQALAQQGSAVASLRVEVQNELERSITGTQLIRMTLCCRAPQPVGMTSIEPLVAGLIQSLPVHQGCPGLNFQWRLETQASV